MPVTLSIKNVPDEVAAQLRARARRSHRSLQGELLVILEEAVSSEKLTVSQLRRRVEEMGLRTGPEAQAIIRETRGALKVSKELVDAVLREPGVYEAG